MKLLIILPSTQRGGVEEYTLTIASAAMNKNWEVYAAFPQTDSTASLIHDLTIKGIHYHPLDIAETIVHRAESLTELAQTIIPRLKTVQEKIPHFIRTLFLLLRLKPDVVMVNLPWTDFCFSSLLACGLLKVPTALVFHIVPFQFSFSNIKLKAYQWAKRRHQQWIALSENNRKLICASFQIPQNQILHVNNGINLIPDGISEDPEKLRLLRRQVRQELGLSETSQIALTVGRLNSQKGYDYLIPSIPHLVKDFPNLKFVWVGDGEQREYLLNRVQGYGVADKVLFLGYRSDVPRLLRSADLFVFPTHYEGQPFSVLEAMANNLPIVASATSGIPEIIEHRIHGLLSRTGDSCDLLEAIRWALLHPDQMQEMSRKAQLRVQEFSEKKMVRETLDILQKLSSTC